MIRTGILLILLFPIILQAQSFEVIEKTSFRTEPSSKGTVLKRVKPGDTGEVISSEKWWTEVLLNEQIGYIKTANIRISKSKKTTPKPAPNIVFTESIVKTKPKTETPKKNKPPEIYNSKTLSKEEDTTFEKKDPELSEESIAVENTKKEEIVPPTVVPENINKDQSDKEPKVEITKVDAVSEAEKIKAASKEVEIALEKKNQEVIDEPIAVAETEKEAVVLSIIVQDSINKTQPTIDPKIETEKTNTTAEAEKIKAQLEAANAALEKKNRELKEAAIALEKAKKELEKKEQQVIPTEQEKDSIQIVPIVTEEKEVAPELEVVQTDTLQLTDQQELGLIPGEDNESESELVTFISMLDVKAGLSIFKESKAEDVVNGLDFEVNCSLLNSYGLGIEAGLNVIHLPNQENSSPYINPFLGLTFGKYGRRMSFTIGPRFYFVTNPGYELIENSNNKNTITEFSSSFMIGAGTNLKYKLSRKLALSLYGSYIGGTVELKESGTIDGETYNDRTENKLNVIGTGIGFSYVF